MTETQYLSRADNSRVTEILSEAKSRTMPCEEDEPFEPITPEKADQMGFPLAWLQDVVWECYGGLNGPRTLLKEVEYDTSTCDECDGEGWKDQHGDTICRDCGLVLNSTPMLVPQDHETIDRASGPVAGSGRNVFFNDGSGKAALNENIVSQSDEPDVQ